MSEANEEYASTEYAVDEYSADASQYTVPRGYYNDDGEFIEEPDFADPAYYDYYSSQSYNYDYSQYYDNNAAYYQANQAAPAVSSNTVTPITSVTPLTSAPTAAPSSSSIRPPIHAPPGTKLYYPSQANPNNPVGPIIVTRSGYAGPHTSLARKDDKKKKKKAITRAAAGEVWEDRTLEDWDENDYRLFAGDLGNDVTEELLFKTFSKYPSLIRTRVVRDGRTMKSKGYGFISFKDPDDFVRAWREMNGKYVGNRPIKLRKSSWKERNLDVKAKKEKERFGPYVKPKK